VRLKCTRIDRIKLRDRERCSGATGVYALIIISDELLISVDEIGIVIDERRALVKTEIVTNGSRKSEKNRVFKRSEQKRS
jgi:hypothetical protein